MFNTIKKTFTLKVKKTTTIVTGFFMTLTFFTLLQCTSSTSETHNKTWHAPEAKLDQYLSQYRPYEMNFDLSGLNETEKTMVKKLIKAAYYIDTIFWLQTSKYGLHLRDSLDAIDNKNAVTLKLLTLINRNSGPYEQLNEYETFIGNKNYYGGDELYPRGMTAEQFDEYINTLSEEEKAEFMYPYTVIKEDGKGGYTAVRYHQEYAPYIKKITKLLREAASLSDNKDFASYLNLKANALESDNYFDADVAWVDLTNTKFDMVFGPFETYADHIKGIKAKYEAFIEIVDEEGTKDLEKYTSYLKDLEQNLPIPDIYKSEVDGLTASFIVVQDIVRTGDGAAGYQAVATNLPNDPAVHEQKGTKKTFWKNMFEARFNAIITPVSNKLIDESQLQYLSADGFFKFVLMHEICHAIGPRTVKVGTEKGKAVNAVIGADYSPLEEAKADICGLYSLAYLMKQGIEDPEKAKSFYVSFLGSLFRSIRFGLDEAHGKAAAISLNYLLEHDGIQYNMENFKWTVNFDKFETVVEELVAELLLLEGNGDKEGVATFFEQWTNETPQLKKALEITKDIPIDVIPERKITWE